MTGGEHGQETWMVVRRDGTIPGGYRVVQAGLRSEEQAKRWAADYKRPHEAMRTSRLYELRMAAMEAPVAEHGQSEAVYCASERAIALATVAYARDAGIEADSAGLAGALIACHSPALGLGRSVCLRDVVDDLHKRAEEALRPDARTWYRVVADHIERAFTESSSPDREKES